ncbi:MAG: hypothetical protein BWX88_05035 [Planctomycetes bacterium ADurb.Bin126]|nr:MAG: hypothetical protein BWX88_05035 [Planctomycetes bacterium ADurb.Bin126]
MPHAGHLCFRPNNSSRSPHGNVSMVTTIIHAGHALFITPRYPQAKHRTPGMPGCGWSRGGAEHGCPHRGQTDACPAKTAPQFTHTALMLLPERTRRAQRSQLTCRKTREPPATSPLEGLAQPTDKGSPTDSQTGVRQVRCLARAKSASSPTAQPLGQTKFKLFSAKMLRLGQDAVNNDFFCIDGAVSWTDSADAGRVPPARPSCRLRNPPQQRCWTRRSRLVTRQRAAGFDGKSMTQFGLGG